MNQDDVEVRTAPLLSVEPDPRRRVIELIAVPYDDWTPVEYQGRMIEESVAPGAFGGVDKRADRERLKVYLEHDPTSWVGIVEKLYPSDPAGLRAELKIRTNSLQVLDDAAEGMLSGLIGVL